MLIILWISQGMLLGNLIAHPNVISLIAFILNVIAVAYFTITATTYVEKEVEG